MNTTALQCKIATVLIMDMKIIPVFRGKPIWYFFPNIIIKHFEKTILKKLFEKTFFLFEKNVF